MLVLQQLFLIGLVVGSISKSIQLLYLWRFRESPYIRRRVPISLYWLNVCLLIVFLGACISGAFDLDCIVPATMIFPAYTFSILCVLERLIAIYAAFAANHEARSHVQRHFKIHNNGISFRASSHRDSIQNIGSNSSPSSPRPRKESKALEGDLEKQTRKLFFHNRQLCHDGRFSASKVIAVLFASIIAASFVGFFATRHRSVLHMSFSTNECQVALRDLWRFVMILSFCSAVFIVVIAVKMRKIKENFFILHELRNMSVLAITLLSTLLTWYLIGPTSSNLLQGWYLFFGFGIIEFAFWISNGDIIRNAILEERRAVVTHATSGTSLAALQPPRQSVNSVRGNTGGPDSEVPVHLRLQGILRDPSNYAVFESFLIKDFSVENAHFWKAVESYKNHVHQGMPLDQMKSIGKMLYQEFISPSGKLCINVSFGTRTQLTNLFEKHDEMDDSFEYKAISLDLLERAQKEVFTLMLKDSFPRYLRSEDYGKASGVEVLRNSPHQL